MGVVDECCLEQVGGVLSGMGGGIVDKCCLERGGVDECCLEQGRGDC